MASYKEVLSKKLLLLPFVGGQYDDDDGYNDDDDDRAMINKMTKMIFSLFVSACEASHLWEDPLSF